MSIAYDYIFIHCIYLRKWNSLHIFWCFRTCRQNEIEEKKIVYLCSSALNWVKKTNSRSMAKKLTRKWLWRKWCSSPKCARADKCVQNDIISATMSSCMAVKQLNCVCVCVFRIKSIFFSLCLVYRFSCQSDIRCRRRRLLVATVW